MTALRRTRGEALEVLRELAAAGPAVVESLALALPAGAVETLAEGLEAAQAAARAPQLADAAGDAGAAPDGRQAGAQAARARLFVEVGGVRYYAEDLVVPSDALAAEGLGLLERAHDAFRARIRAAEAEREGA